MKGQFYVGLSPGEPDPKKLRRQQIVDWWNDYDVCGTSGATTSEVLEVLRLEVTECLNRPAPDVARATNLTAKAILLISGQLDL